jgi:DNA polymerase/3'-5' exonuclease PolX
MAQSRPTNGEIANVLVRIADLLESMDANEFRVRAYRNAARTLRGAVTASSGLLEGRRVVRGSEAECRQYYESEG